MIRVSVIMTSYNKPEYVARSLESILRQSEKNFELFLMDDASNQDTMAAVAPYLSDPRVRFFRSGVRSITERTVKTRYAVLINRALLQIKGKYVTYATDDNVYHPQRLEKMADYLEAHPSISIVYSGSETRYLDERQHVVRTLRRPATRVLHLAPCAVDHCSVMHRRLLLPQLKKRFGSYWDEDPCYYRIGDARFFWRLNHLAPFYPLNETLDTNYITTRSLHHQLFAPTKNEFVSRLPQQHTCKELRESLAQFFKEKGRPQ
ncbi:MAG: glycosyltransferase [Sporolactobacillus sp.]|jgi:glycosyltransferase involved in cell wall biosynthesis|nr:glycosyltransferase [Sporolactobacillus sp.]